MLIHNNLARAYLISGDETFLTTEVREKIILSAKSQGFLEHVIYHIETGFQWEAILAATQNQSLFSEKQIIDIRNPNAKFDDMIIEILEKLDNSNLFIITTEKLTVAQQKTKWFLSLKKIGVYTPIWPIERHALNQWIMERAKKYMLQIDKQSAELLAECTEGNLLATHQAIEKLSLLYPKESISPEKISAVLSDNMRFSIFDLTKYLLLNDQKQLTRIILSLQKTSDELPLVLFMITKEIRELLTLQTRIQNGDSLQMVLSTVWSFKKPLLQTALKNTSINQLQNSLSQASKIDQMIKGYETGSAWENILILCLTLCKN